MYFLTILVIYVIFFLNEFPLCFLSTGYGLVVTEVRFLCSLLYYWASHMHLCKIFTFYGNRLRLKLRLLSTDTLASLQFSDTSKLLFCTFICTIYCTSIHPISHRLIEDAGPPYIFIANLSQYSNTVLPLKFCGISSILLGFSHNPFWYSHVSFLTWASFQSFQHCMLVLVLADQT